MTVREDSRRLLIVNEEFFSLSRYGTRTYHPYRLFFMVNPKPLLFRMVGIKKNE